MAIKVSEEREQVGGWGKAAATPDGDVGKVLRDGRIVENAVLDGASGVALPLGSVSYEALRGAQDEHTRRRRQGLRIGPDCCGASRQHNP